MTEDKRKDADAAGGAEAGMAEGTAGGPGRGEGLKEASEEAVRDMENRRDGRGHAGTGDYG